MIEIKAKRNIELYSIIAIAKVWVEEDRPDILWLLQNYSDNRVFSTGESNTLEQYLKNYFNLVDDDGNLTDFARNLIREERTKIMVPESGIYEFILFDDPFKEKTYPVNFIRHTRFSRKDLNEEGRDFISFKSLERTNFTSWNKEETKFKIQFIKSGQVQFPVVLDRSTFTAQINFTLSSKKKSLSIKMYNRSLEFKTNSVNLLDLEETCEVIIPNWDSNLDSQRITFNDAKKLNKHYDFIRNYESESPLPFKSINDKNIYSVEIKNIPLLPNNEKEAKTWIIFLLEHKLNSADSYMTSRLVDEILNKIIEEKLLEIAFPEIKSSFSFKELLDTYKEKDSNIFWRVRIADDLSVEIK